MKKIMINDKECNIKDNISLAEKYAMADIIINACVVTDEQGFLYVDELQREMITNICLVKFYTDYELPDDITSELYEELENQQVYLTIKNDIVADEALVEKQVDSIINYKVNVKQSVAYIVQEKLGQLINKIPEIDNIQNLIENGVKAVNNLDETKLKIVADSLGKNKVIKQTKKEISNSKTK